MLRAVAGAEAVGVDISGWLVICTILIALFLALGKRRHEYLTLQGAAAAHRPDPRRVQRGLPRPDDRGRHRVHRDRLRALHDVAGDRGQVPHARCCRSRCPSCSTGSSATSTCSTVASWAAIPSDLLLATARSWSTRCSGWSLVASSTPRSGRSRGRTLTPSASLRSRPSRAGAAIRCGPGAWTARAAQPPGGAEPGAGARAGPRLRRRRGARAGRTLVRRDRRAPTASWTSMPRTGRLTVRGRAVPGRDAAALRAARLVPAGDAGHQVRHRWAAASPPTCTARTIIGTARFGDFVRAPPLRWPTAAIVACGPDVERELFLATVGGMGLTGLIARGDLPPARRSRPRVDRGGDRGACADLERDARAASKRARGDWPYTVGWIDCLARGRDLGRGVLMRGRHARADEAGARPPPARRALARPVDAPEWLLNPHAHAALQRPATTGPHGAGRRARAASSYEPFFYPLDAVRDWNRLYGRARLPAVPVRAAARGGRARRSRAFLERLAARGRARRSSRDQGLRPRLRRLSVVPRRGHDAGARPAVSRRRDRGPGPRAGRAA